MAAKKSNRIKTTAVAPPATQQEAETLLDEIGKLQREVSNIENAMNDELSAIKKRYEEQAQPHNDAIADMFHRLHMWAEANRGELLKGKSKTARLATGELQWRTTPPRVSIRGQDTVIETFKKVGLQDLLRTKEEINKEAVLNEPERIEGLKGISITQKEEFAAKPFSSQIERAEAIKKVA